MLIFNGIVKLINNSVTPQEIACVYPQLQTNDNCLCIKLFNTNSFVPVECSLFNTIYYLRRAFDCYDFYCKIFDTDDNSYTCINICHMIMLLAENIIEVVGFSLKPYPDGYDCFNPPSNFVFPAPHFRKGWYLGFDHLNAFKSLQEYYESLGYNKEISRSMSKSAFYDAREFELNNDK